MKADASSPRPSTGERIAWLWGFWRPHRGMLVFLFLLTLISSGVTIAYPMVWKIVLDYLTKAKEASGGAPTIGGAGAVPDATLHKVLYILGAIAVGRFLAGFYPAFRQWMNMKIDVAVREKVFARILTKDYRFFNRFGTGDLVTRLLDDISEYPKIAWFSCSGVFRAVDSGSKLVFCVGAMLYLDARLALLSLVPLPIMMYVIYRVRAQLTEAAEKTQKAISETNEMLEKSFTGIRIVKAFGSEPGQGQALNRILQHRVGVQYRYQKLWAVLSTFDTVAGRTGQLVVLAVGGIMAVRGEITYGTIYAFYIYLDMLVQPMWDLPNLVVTSRQAFVCIDREEELMQFPVEVSHSDQGERLGAIESLGFDRVTFSYEDARPALREVSFEVRRGETLAVVGPVAAGKTTILKLACGLLNPGEGSIRVNGHPLDHWRWEDFRGQVGYAPQDSLLFSESVRENVAMGRTFGEGAMPGDENRPDAHRIERFEGGERTGRQDGAPSAPVESRNETWVRHVLGIAQMQAELAQMTQGIETVLGQKGSKVSGGQRQRISIGRALYRRPEILLLDDCTSSLDAENEDRLWAGIRDLLPDTTILLVSHRLATIRRAERILVLERGTLCDLGTHEELAARSEVYRRFLERAEESEMVLGPAKTDEPADVRV